MSDDRPEKHTRECDINKADGAEHCTCDPTPTGSETATAFYGRSFCPDCDTQQRFNRISKSPRGRNRFQCSKCGYVAVNQATEESDDRPEKTCSTKDCSLPASKVHGRSGLCGSCFMDSLNLDEYTYDPTPTGSETAEEIADGVVDYDTKCGCDHDDCCFCRHDMIECARRAAVEALEWCKTMIVDWDELAVAPWEEKYGVREDAQLIEAVMAHLAALKADTRGGPSDCICGRCNASDDRPERTNPLDIVNPECVVDPTPPAKGEVDVSDCPGCGRAVYNPSTSNQRCPSCSRSNEEWNPTPAGSETAEEIKRYIRTIDGSLIPTSLERGDEVWVRYADHRRALAASEEEASGWACAVFVEAIRGLADAAIIKQRTYTAADSLAIVKQLATKANELRRALAASEEMQRGLQGSIDSLAAKLESAKENEGKYVKMLAAGEEERKRLDEENDRFCDDAEKIQDRYVALEQQRDRLREALRIVRSDLLIGGINVERTVEQIDAALAEGEK